MTDALRLNTGVVGAAPEDEDLLVRTTLAGSGAARAAEVVDRIAAALSRSLEDRDVERLGEVVAACGSLERMLVERAPGAVRLDVFLNRFVSLRAIAVSGGVFRVRAADVEVDFDVARAVAFVVCDLIAVAERLPSGRLPDVMIAVAPADGELVIALAVPEACHIPVPRLAGWRALERAERLVRSLGGTFGRGVRNGTMLLGATLQVCDG